MQLRPGKSDGSNKPNRIAEIQTLSKEKGPKTARALHKMSGKHGQPRSHSAWAGALRVTAAFIVLNHETRDPARDP